MTEIERLEREIAALEKRLAELRAKEPDWEAWRPALEAGYATWDADVHAATPLDNGDKENIRLIIAALPLAPIASPMSEEEEIEALAHQSQFFPDKLGNRTPFEAALWAIRETLRRAPKAWPGEAIEALQQIAHNNWKDQSRAKRVAKDALADIMGRVA